MATMYRGYDIFPAETGFVAIDLDGTVIARGDTEEKVMDAIDRWKREQRKAQESK